MRKWYLFLFGALLLGALALVVGCEGGEGPTGEKGPKGPTGPGGIDVSAQPPTDRYFSVGITNGTMTGVTGVKHLFITFDSTTESSRDTIVADYVSNPPLIDGFDGEEPEWGEHSSKIQLDFMNLQQDMTLHDPNIYQAVCRAAYDEEYLYLLLQWKEINITIKTADGRDSTLVDDSKSDDFNELVLDIPNVIEECDTLGVCDTLFTALRTDSVIDYVDTIYYPPPPEPPLIIYYDTVWTVDTTCIWTSTGKGEDRAVVIWSEADEPTWADVAFNLLFRDDGYQPSLPAGMTIDIWQWGASTSNPVCVADDWFLTDGGLLFDAGGAPYLDNYLFPDSMPRYMHREDPNRKTYSEPGVRIYPLWYYDAVGYFWRGWAVNRAVYVPGIVTSIPSESRADVYARGVYHDAVWTVEFRRARRTHSADDLVF